MSSASFETALSFLQKTNSNNGVSVYDDLSNLLLKVLEDKPEGSVDLLSTYLLNKAKEFQSDEAGVNVAGSDLSKAGSVQSSSALFKAAEPTLDAETGEPIDAPAPNTAYETENLLQNSSLFEAVGVGLGKDEMYNVALTLKSLAEDASKSLKTVRFFGKILGTGSDYYVFETTSDLEPEAPTTAEGETPAEVGEGANGFTYFVCSQLGGSFTQLPAVTPQQIKVSRQVKKFFSGDLDAEVSAYPIFPGKESNYLRAQIARIASTTVICPTGYFSVGEDGETLDSNDDYEPANATEFQTAEAWSHRYKHLKTQGRCTVFVAESDDEPTEPTEEEQETGPDRLSSCSGDAEVNGGSAWSPLSSSTVAGMKYQVCGVRSNYWTGAYAVASGKNWSNIYVGHGVKNTAYVPVPPPTPSGEYNEALVESIELPPKPEVEDAEEEDAEETPADE